MSFSHPHPTQPDNTNVMHLSVLAYGKKQGLLITEAAAMPEYESSHMASLYDGSGRSGKAQEFQLAHPTRNTLLPRLSHAQKKR